MLAEPATPSGGPMPQGRFIALRSAEPGVSAVAAQSRATRTTSTAWA